MCHELVSEKRKILRVLFTLKYHSSVDEEELRKKEEKERKLADRRARLTRLFQEDERRYQDEREQKYRESRHRTVHHHIVYPEVLYGMAKCMRLERHREFI